MKTYGKVLTGLIVVLFLTSCVSREKIVYMQNKATAADSTLTYEPVLQADDVLSIIVSSESIEAALPYNIRTLGIQNATESIAGNQNYQAYIVSKEGTIEFPVLGTIKLGGLTKTEAVAKMKTLLTDHVKDAVVTMRLLNFKVSVLGEVARPGTFTINSERITLLEALSKAGDLSIYGQRNNILVIREQDGVKTMQRIDLTKSDFINSPFYYLVQNDVVYVEPNKTKINSSAVGPNLTVALSAISLLVTIFAVITR